MIIEMHGTGDDLCAATRLHSAVQGALMRLPQEYRKQIYEIRNCRTTSHAAFGSLRLPPSLEVRGPGESIADRSAITAVAKCLSTLNYTLVTVTAEYARTYAVQQPTPAQPA